MKRGAKQALSERSRPHIERLERAMSALWRMYVQATRPGVDVSNDAALLKEAGVRQWLHAKPPPWCDIVTDDEESSVVSEEEVSNVVGRVIRRMCYVP